jgi:bifunctional non-homologous end joining protein LigD
MAAAAPSSSDERVVHLSNVDKVFWPVERYTKGDLLAYYDTVAPLILPYLRDRPLVLTRFPDGIHGKSFYQQDAPAWRPEWMRTVRASGEGREVDHFVADDERALAYLVNLGAIPIHVWASRAPDLERPDWAIVDLDPKGAPFAHVARLARAIHALCDEIGLPAFVKTSGQAGLHVLVPLGGACTHAQAQQLAFLLARAVADAHPAIATLARPLSARAGRVYLDTLQNGRGKTIAAPLCVRPRPGAPVSTPLSWREVRDDLDPARLTIRTVPRRLARWDDPLTPLLSLRPDLVSALARLSRRLADAAARARRAPSRPRSSPR